jgi:hypothetical protein
VKYIEHCNECEEKLGKDWAVVHRWLDEFAKPGNMQFHRAYRHHDTGIEEARKRWGDDAAEAARLHIVSDYGYVPSEEESDKMYNLPV